MRLIVLAATLGAGLVAASSAVAQDRGQQPADPDQNSDGDILVTATRTGATRLQDTPLAITALDGNLLQSSGARDIRDVQAFTPSLSITQNARAAQPYIRGVGSNNSFAGSDPSVSLYVDGIYIARPTSFFAEFVGVERVEVLRGPQGTLYGRNSIGGAINIISRKPGDELRAEGSVTLGNYDLRRGETYLNVPLAEGKFAVSLAGRYSDHDGYYASVVKGIGRSDVERDRFIQGQVRFTPSDALELIFRGDYSHSGSTPGTSLKTRTATGYDPIVDSLVGVPDALAFNVPATADVDDWGISGEINLKLANQLTLTSRTAYRESKGSRQTDNDFSAANLRLSLTGQDSNQLSQEFLLSGSADRIKYVAGFYYIREHINDYSVVPNFTNNTTQLISPSVSSEAAAGFAQATYDVTDTIALTAGLRYTDESKTFAQLRGTKTTSTGAWLAGNPVTYVAKRHDTALTPKFGVEFRPKQDLLVYASVTRGFKSGGYSYTSSNPAQGFRPETLWAYEAGIKSDFADHKLRLNLSAFHYDYKGLQVQSFITIGVIDIVNAASAKIDGIEFEGQFRPVEGLTLGAAVTYLDARYDNFPKAIGPNNVSFDASGHRMNAAPKWAYALNAELHHEFDFGELFGRVDFAWKGRQYFTALNVPLESQASYGLLNANLGVRFAHGHLEASVFGRNLTDKRYFTTANTVGAVAYGTLGAPQTYGVTLKARY